MGTKDRRHLALFAYYYPPLGGAGSQRALSFARHLPSLGWRVTVITPREGVYGRDGSLPAGDLPGVRVLRTGSLEPAALLRRLKGGAPSAVEGAGSYVEEAELGAFASAVRSVARKLLYFPDASGGWVRPAAAAAREVHAGDPFDAVLSSSPPVSAHLAARRFARPAGVPLVLDFRDLWEPAVEGAARASRLLGGLLESSAAVLTVSRGYAEWIGSRAGRPVAVVRNGFEPREPEPPPPGLPEEPFLLHAGTTYGARQDFGVLAGVLGEVRAAGGALHLRMPGRVDPSTRGRLAAAEASGAVRFEGFLPSDEIHRREAAAAAVVAFAWAGEGDDPISRGHLPAKLFEALGSGRPVLLLAEPGTEAARLGAEAGVEPLSPRDAGRLRGVLGALARGEVPPGLRPDAAAAARFTRAAAAADLASTLDGVLAPGGAR